uniref:Ectonucleoside triphosphate diphosphohydrolase 3 n=1 Tax=Monopterus albus TaxID=43700 RepID=A0A3Q3K3R7_MONAL
FFYPISCQQKMVSKRKVGYKCRIAGVLLLLLASIAALVAVAVIQDKWRFKQYNLEYGIVIDSGSSRSNVYVYEWPGEKENETGVVKQIANCRVAGESLKMLKHGNHSKTAWTKSSKGATAGMRLLHDKDEQRSNEILARLREYLSSLPFSFQNASIITGQEEGLYGWITVNYLKGNFIEKNLWNTYARPQGAKTVGSMDLGGASTQIAFAVQEDLSGPDYMHVQLYGYPYNVYTHSYLCYGKNEAEKKVLDKVVQESSDPANIINPCYPKGFTNTMNASAIYETACTKKPPNYNPEQKLSMVGDGDSDKCGSIVKSIFDFETCSSSHCSFNNVGQPPVTGEFMAYAGFFHTAKILLLNGTSDLDQFNSSLTKFCQTQWTPLKKEKQGVNDAYLKSFCYSAHYVFTLLVDGYKFDKETWKNIDFQKEVKNTSIGWSLGYMLSMSNMIPSEVKELPPMTDPVFAGLIFLFSALTIVTVVIVFIILIRTCY